MVPRDHEFSNLSVDGNLLAKKTIIANNVQTNTLAVAHKLTLANGVQATNFTVNDIKNITNINVTDLTVTNINTTNITSTTINSNTINSETITLGGNSSTKEGLQDTTNTKVTKDKVDTKAVTANNVTCQLVTTPTLTTPLITNCQTLNAVSIVATTASMTNATATSVTATSGEISNLSTGDFKATTLNTTNESVAGLLTMTGTLSAATASVGSLVSTTMTSTSSSTATENATTANLTTMIATSSAITSLTAGSLTTDILSINTSALDLQSQVLAVDTAASVVAGTIPRFSFPLRSNVSGLSPSIIAPLAYTNFYGDGSDGDVIITSTVTLTRNMYYNRLTLAGGTLIPNGNIIYAKDSINFAGGIISANGSNGGDGQQINPFVGGTAGAGSVSTGVLPAGLNGIAGASKPSNGANVTIALGSVFGGLGGTGGRVAGSGSHYIFTNPLWANTTSLLMNPFFLSLLPTNNSTAFGGYPSTGGGGGDSDSKGGGGGGGGGGGWIVLLTPLCFVFSTGTFLQAKGGNGGNGGPFANFGAAGAGGAGGVVLVITQSNEVPTSSNALVTGGSAGTVGQGTPPTAAASGVFRLVQL